jgi:diguanylate cyclase (GGDEF)-like protein
VVGTRSDLQKDPIDGAALKSHGQVGEAIMALANIGLLVVISAAYGFSPSATKNLFDPVWVAIGVFGLTAVARYLAAKFERMPVWASYVSIVLDFVVLYTVIVSFSVKYNQPAAFVLKSPSVAFVFVFVGLRALRFDVGQVLFAAGVAIIGWVGVIGWVVGEDGNAAVTRSYVEYLNGSYLLFGAEVEKCLAMVAFAAALAFAMHRGHTFLYRALKEAGHARSSYAREQELTKQLTTVVQARADANALLDKAAHFDALTGLENRRCFTRQVGAVGKAFWRGETGKYTVALVDLDQFRSFNDGFGRLIGDSAILAAGVRLSANLAEGEILARVGADEFAILSHTATTAAQALELASRLRDLFDDPLDADGTLFAAGASVGVAVAEEGDRGSCVFAYADIALNEAKAKGRRRIALHEPKTRGVAAGRLKLEAQLRGALERNEMLLYYQPLYALHDGSIAGWEALMRWKPVDGNMISPAEFIPIAEETGAIADLGAWALHQASADAQLFLAAGACPTAFMSVNVSPFQLAETDRLRTAVSAALATHATLKLEVTESAFVEDPIEALRALQSFKSQGASLALDDFGVGASSLAQLRQFPFSTLKIDQTFLRDETPEGRRFFASIVNVGKSLGMDIVAEGIETKEHLELCTVLGVTYGQGYYLARPMPASQILANQALDGQSLAQVAA